MIMKTNNLQERFYLSEKRRVISHLQGEVRRQGKGKVAHA
jgi:hypothetical protein